MPIETLLIAFLVLALVIVVIGYFIAKVILKNDIRLASPMGTGSWKFTESWASTLTGSGAILGLILAAEVLPEQTQIPKDTFVMLNLMFGVIVVAATLLYNAVRLPRLVPGEKVHDVETITETEQSVPKQFTVNYIDQKPQTTENQGFVLIFLFASAIILWALFGQLATTWYLLDEITFVSSFIERTFRWLIRITAGLAIIYGIGSVPWTLYNQVNRKDKRWIVM